MNGAAAKPAQPLAARLRSIRFGELTRGPRAAILAALFFLVLTVAALGPTLFSREQVFSSAERDLALQFIHWRKFGFDELRAGRLALWNPHIYCGAPFFGGFQSALLYPPNWLFLCLPLAVAINVGIALHVFLAGGGMFLWLRERGLSFAAALFGGMLFMFSGPFYPHIYAGHLPNLCTMAWGPFVFLAIDGWLRWRTSGWLLLGASSVSMQILAGHPQYVFYTGVAAALYAAGRLTAARDRLQAGAGLAAFPLAGAALSAVQLCEGFHAAGESVRNHGTDLAFAALFSLPPENFLTLLVPNFFGSLTTHDYWGRWFLWEMSLFFGATGLVMAGYAVAKGPRRPVWSCAAVGLVLLVLALGAYTPLFPWLYRHGPGFSRFRGWSKFSYLAILLLIVVSATGFDTLLRAGVHGLRLGLIVLGVAVAVGFLSLLASRSAAAHEPWRRWIQELAASNEQFVGADDAKDARYAASAARYAARQLRWTALTLSALAALLLLARRYPRALVGVLVLASVEMLFFARSCLDHFALHDVLTTPDAQFLSAHAGDGSRVSDENNHDLALSFGGHDLWGYDPGVLRRYAEWIAGSQDCDPDAASEKLKLDRVPPVFASLLRARCMIPRDWSPDDGEQPITEDGVPVPPAPRLMLLTHYRVIPGRNEELDAIFDPGFQPTQEVLLETAPVPAPTGAAQPGRVWLVAETTDRLTIEADLQAPAILMVTDAYSDGWRARSLLREPTGGAPPRYQVLPADYCLRGIPLDQGHHKILLEYRPTAFVVGKWLSLVSLCLYLVALIAWLRHRRRVPTPPANPTPPHPERPLTSPVGNLSHRRRAAGDEPPPVAR